MCGVEIHTSGFRSTNDPTHKHHRNATRSALIFRFDCCPSSDDDGALGFVFNMHWAKPTGLPAHGDEDVERESELPPARARIVVLRL